MKPERFAQDAARFIKSLERMQGIVMLDPTHEARKLVILSCPERPVPDVELVEELLGFSTCVEHHRPDWLGRQLGARELLDLTPGRLGAWSHKLQLLQRSRGLEALIRSGTGALKRYQREDIQQKLDAFEDHYTRLRDVHMLLEDPDTAPLAPYLIHAPWMLPDASSHVYRQSLQVAVNVALERVRSQHVTHPEVLASLARVAGFCGEEGGRSLADETHLGVAYDAGAHHHTSPAILAASCVPQMPAHTLRELTRCGGCASEQWAAMACVRVGRLLGVRAARELIHHGTARLRQGAARVHQIARCAQRFLTSCHTLAHPERLGELYADMQWLRYEAHGGGLTRALARHLISMLEALEFDTAQLPSQTMLWRAVLGAQTGHDPAAVGDVLWETTCAHANLHAPGEDLSITRSICKLMLTMPGEPMPGIAKLDRKGLEKLSWSLEGLPQASTIPLLPALIAHADHNKISHAVKSLLKEVALDPHEFELLMKHPFVCEHADDLPRHPDAREALWRCIGELDEMGLLEHLDLENGWLVRLFVQGRKGHEFNVLTIARALSHTQQHTALASQIHAFCRAAQRHDSTFSRALDAWRDTRGIIQDHTRDITRIARSFLTDVDPESLEALRDKIARYLHHKRQLGEPEQLSNNLLKKLTDPADSIAAQLAALQDKLQDDSIPEVQRARHRARHDALQAGEHPKARRKRLKSARNLLDQSLAQLESRSLAALLDGALLDVLARVTGRTHPLEVLTPELRSVLAVSQSEEFHPELFAHFLSTALGGTPRVDLEENRRWLATQTHTDIDLERWERGFTMRSSQDDTTLCIKTEHDLLRAAHMGTWFDTCLSLEDGFHAMSALSHALDANKHVVYVENKRGEVIARKLIAISTRGGLIGYPVYVREGISRESMEVLIDGVIEAFAGECGLPMVGEGKPADIRTLEGEGAYHDGVEVWHIDRHDHHTFPSPPPMWGSDIDSQLEWALDMARESGDVALMKAVAWRMRRPWCHHAVAALITHDPSAASRWLAANRQYGDPPAAIAHAIWWHGDHDPRARHDLMGLATSKDDAWYALDFSLWNMPMEQELVEELGARMLKRLLAFEREPSVFAASSFEHAARNNHVFRHLRPSILLELLDSAVVLYHRLGLKGSWHEDEAVRLKDSYHESLRLAWLHQGAEEQALGDMIRGARHHDMVSIVARFAAEVPSETIARALWARWSRHDTLKLPADVREELLTALAAQDEALQSLSIPDDELTPAEVSSPEVLRDLVLAHAQRHGQARAERRALMRALEATQIACRTQRIDQIGHEDVREAFEQLARCTHDDLHAVITHHASLCHIDDLRTHDREVERILGIAQVAARRREIGETDSLRYIERFVKGSPQHRADAVREEMARFSAHGYPRMGHVIWSLASDLAHEFLPEELIVLAHMSLGSNDVIYNTKERVETFMDWMSCHPEPTRAVHEWADTHGSFYRYDCASDMGVTAVIDALDHPSRAIQRVASELIVVMADHAAEWGRMEMLVDVQHRVLSGQGVECAERLLDCIFTPSEHHDALTPEMLCEHVFPQSSWQDPISFGTLRRLVRRASKVWTPEQITSCRALIATHEQKPRAHAFEQLWAHLVSEA